MKILDDAREALILAEDVLSRRPFSTEIWPNGMHPQIGIEIIRKALAAIPPQGDAREKLWHMIAKHIACEEDCQKWPNGCGCAMNAADAILAEPESAYDNPRDPYASPDRIPPDYPGK